MTLVPAASTQRFDSGTIASGKIVPVADSTGVTVDSSTYNDTIKGSGKLTTLVFPADASVIAVAVAGDAFPRFVMGADPNDYALFSFGDGTYDPASAGCSIALGAQGGMVLASHAAGHVLLGAQTPDPLGAVRLDQVSPRGTVTSGALSTVQLVSATGAQVSTTSDVQTVTPVTFSPTGIATATCLVALSPDNVTYSALVTKTYPAVATLAGSVDEVSIRVPAGWYVKLTATNAALGLTTYY